MEEVILKPECIEVNHEIEEPKSEENFLLANNYKANNFAEPTLKMEINTINSIKEEPLDEEDLQTVFKNETNTPENIEEFLIKLEEGEVKTENDLNIIQNVSPALDMRPSVSEANLAEHTKPTDLACAEVATAIPVTPVPSTSTEEIENTKLPVPTVGSALLETENYFLEQEVEKLKNTMKYMQEKFCYENIRENDKLVLLYTGLPSNKIFEALYTLIKDVEIKYYLNWTFTKLEKIDQLLLTLMKLRLNSPHLDLAQRFGISSAGVTNVFLTFVHLLYECLYEQLMKNIPSRKKNLTCLQSCFGNFTNCRIVLDCTEIFTVVARKSMKSQRLAYSSYEHHNTYKGLIGVAPNGVIIYVSDLYVGSTSDQKIVQDSGILQHIEAGDLILADKGFLIQDILPQGVSLNIPPFSRTTLCTEEQVKKTENIAKDRIHVERAMRRMKCYRILSFIPESLCPFGDVIFKTVAALTNLQYPLIKEVEELFDDDDLLL